MREQGRNKTGIASLPHVKLLLMGAPGLTGERQEHLCHRLLRRSRPEETPLSGARHPQNQVGDRRLAGSVPLPAQHTVDVFEDRKDPTSKQFDDDELIRSLTEAQEVGIDVPEDSVTYDQQEVDPKKVRPIQMEEFLRMCLTTTFGAQRRRYCSPHDFDAADRNWYPRRRQGPCLFQQLLEDDWVTGSLIGPPARIKVDKKNALR